MNDLVEITKGECAGDVGTIDEGWRAGAICQRVVVDDRVRMIPSVWVERMFHWEAGQPEKDSKRVDRNIII